MRKFLLLPLALLIACLMAAAAFATALPPEASPAEAASAIEPLPTVTKAPTSLKVPVAMTVTSGALASTVEIPENAVPLAGASAVPQPTAAPTDNGPGSFSNPYESLKELRAARAFDDILGKHFLRNGVLHRIGPRANDNTYNVSKWTGTDWAITNLFVNR